MLFTKAAVVAAVAVSANGFLLPSSLEPVAAGLPSSIDNVVESRLVKLDCPGCAFYEGQGQDGKPVVSDVANYLVLNFTVDGEKLLVNDRQLYPITMPPPLFTAHQVPASVNLVDFVITETVQDVSGRKSPFHTVRLGTAVMLQEIEEKTHNVRLVKVLFKIGELEGRIVERLDLVKLSLLESDGKAFIEDFSVVPASTPATRPRVGCKHHRRPAHGHHAHGHAHGHRHGKFHRFIHRLVSFTMNFVFPVLVGALAGVTVGLAAVVISQLVVMVWAKMTGRGYVRLEQEDASDADFKDVKEPLPVYEEVVIVSEKESVQ